MNDFIDQNQSSNISSPFARINYDKSTESFPEQSNLPPPFNLLRRRTLDYQITLSELSQTVEKNQIIVTFPYFVINPLGYFKKIWKSIMLFAFLYTILIYPTLLAFRLMEFSWDDEYLIIGVFVDFCFFIDIFFSFFTAFEDKRGKLVYKSQEIAIAYAKTWFLFDLSTSIPFYWIFATKGSHSLPLKNNFRDFIQIEVPMEFKVLHLLRIVKIARLYANTQQIEYFLIKTLKVDRQAFLTLKFVSFIAIIVHISSCVWVFLSKLQNVDDLNSSWVFVNQVQDFSDLSEIEKYVTSVYFIVTVLLTVGYGDLVPKTNLEKVYFIISIFFALGVFGYIMTTCITLFSVRLSRMARYFHMADQFLLGFKVRFRLSKILHWKMLFFFKKSCFFDDNSLEKNQKKLLNLLPLETHYDVVYFLFQNFLNKFDFFVDKPMSFSIRILPLLKPSYFLPGDEIFKHGDPSLFVYFITKGRVVTCCEDNTGKERAQIYLEGSYFGEVDIILGQERLENCYAETELHLLKIEKKEFLKLLLDYESVRAEVVALAQQRSVVRKLYRKTNPSDQSLLPSSYWIWKRNKECNEHSIEDAHLIQRRSTIRKSILEGSTLMGNLNLALSPSSRLKNGRTSKLFPRKNTLTQNQGFSNFSKMNNEDVEVEEGEVEKIAIEKIAGMFKDEIGLASNRKHILKIFEIIDQKEKLDLQKKKKKIKMT